MFQRRQARVVLVLLVVAAIALITIDFRAEDGGPLDRVRDGATIVLRPVQEGLSTLVRPFGDLGTSVRDVFQTRAENQRLRAENERLAERRSAVVDLERENDELRELLAIRERTGLETVAARTVALAPSNFEWTITIDVGTNDGVERDMPVIDGDGLVGRVIQATPDAARVLLAIDPNFSAAARSARTGEIGTIDGRGGDPMLLRPLEPEADLEVGDEIVTSAYQGGLFPGGIPIGTVAELGDTTSRLVRELTVRPFVDFTRLHHVLVVRSAPVEEIPPLTGVPDVEFDPPPVDPTLDPEDVEDGDGTDGDSPDGDGADGDGADGETDGDSETDGDGADGDGDGAGGAAP